MRESSDIVLSVKNVSKCFEMYDRPVNRLTQMLFGRTGRKWYKEFWALKDVSFDVHKGECVGIIGRNGAGKSTLLQVITGTLAPTSGTVERNGRIAALLELGSGFNPEFSGRENIYLNGSILGLTKSEIDARYDDIAAFADIGEFIDQPVKTYSSGMLVRLAFAVNACVDPDVLIVDEALAVGDVFFQQKCMARMRQLRDSGVSLLFVSHAMDTVRALCNRAVYIKNGLVDGIGNPRELCQQYQLSEIEKKSEVRAAMSASGAQVPIFGTSGTARFAVDKQFDKHVAERRGTGDARFVSAYFYNLAGDIVTDVENGENIKYVISFILQKDIPAGAVTTIACRDRVGNVIMGYKLPAIGKALPALSAGDRCVLEFSLKISLLAGQYFWSASIQPDVYNPDIRYDVCIDAAPMRVLKAATPYYEHQWGFCEMNVEDVKFLKEEI